MTLYVHRAERSDALVIALADLLAQPLDDVFAEEVVAVPARGVERWLTQRLAHRLGSREGHDDGICAAVRFPSPARLLAEVVGRPEDDPWTPERLVWPLLEVLDEGVGDPALAAVTGHLGLDGNPVDGDPRDPDVRSRREHRLGRRYATARRLAGLFTGYAMSRPSLVRAWGAGLDEDGLGEPLPPDLRWQPTVWRRMRAKIEGPDPVERLTVARDRLHVDPTTVALPARVSLFGPTALPAAHRELLIDLARHRDVHLWLPHPSPALWARMTAATRSTAVADRSVGRPVPRSVDPTVALVRNPLLASLGRDSREVHTVLQGMVDVDQHLPPRPETRQVAGPAGHADRTAPDTLLTRLQDRMRHDSAESDPRPLDPRDRSVQVHACHGPTREVDVLRDVLARSFADDETLDPSDVLVLCPDIETFAPLISAAFGLADVVESDETGGSVGHPAHHIRVRLADRSLRQTNPVLGVVTRLLDLAGGRFTASEVLDLLATVPVRQRFRLDEDDLEQIAAWVAESGVRWGVDATHRGDYKLGDFGQNTWRAGLDRLLVGVAMSEEDQQWLGLALPLDDVGSADIERAGRLTEAVTRLAGVLDGWTGPRTLQEWVDSILQAVELLTALPPSAGWQLAEVRRELTTVLTDAGGRAGDVVLRLDDVRALLARVLAGRPTRANFRTGTLTVCTMVPMRSVPHRVICLLGLDDGVYPRQSVRDGDDVTARTPTVGERDPRSEDRQLLLDAVMAAGERLVITYAGADERTGATRPPAVPLGELLDELDNTAGGAVRGQVLVRHPLQPFDRRTVSPGELGVPGQPFTFDPAALAGAKAAASPRLEPAMFLPAPLPPPRGGPGSGGDVDLADLLEMTKSPVRAFLRRRLDVAVRFDAEEPQDGVPVALDGLQSWNIGDRLLRGRLAGHDEQRLEQIEWRRGELPPGKLGRRALGEVLTKVRPLADRTARLREPGRRSLDVVAPFAPGRAVRGTIDTLYGSTLVTVTYSQLGPAARLAAWARLLTLTVAEPDGTWGAETVGRGSTGPRRASVPPLTPAEAVGYLGQLIDVFDRAMAEPVPLPLKASAVYAERRRRGGSVSDAEQAAEKMWVSGQYPGEDADSAHVLVYGAGRPFSAVLAAPARPDETWSENGDPEPHRFGQLAVRLWGPLLDCESSGPL